MSQQQTVDIFREAILLVIRCGGPILILCMAVGIIIAIFQAVTSIHEQSIAFVLKMIVVIVYLVYGGSWVLRSLTDFATMLFQMMV